MGLFLRFTKQESSTNIDMQDCASSDRHVLLGNNVSTSGTILLLTLFGLPTCWKLNRIRQCGKHMSEKTA